MSVVPAVCYNQACQTVQMLLTETSALKAAVCYSSNKAIKLEELLVYCNPAHFVVGVLSDLGRPSIDLPNNLSPAGFGGQSPYAFLKSCPTSLG